MLTPFDSFALFARDAVTETWFRALPRVLLEYLWAGGRHDHVYAATRMLAPVNAGLHQARFAALDPDRSRGISIAYEALESPVPLVETLLMVSALSTMHPAIWSVAPRSHDHVPKHHLPRLLAADALPPVDKLGNDPRLLSWRAARGTEQERNELFTRVFQSGGLGFAPHCELAAARFCGAWDLIPDYLLPEAAALAALSRDAVGVAACVDRQRGGYVEAVCRVALASPSLEQDWIQVIREKAANHEEDFAEGLITQYKAELFQWASARVAGAEEMDALVLRSLERAFSAAEAYAQSSSEENAPVDSTAGHYRTKRLVAEASSTNGDRAKIAKVLESIAQAGAQGHFQLATDVLAALEDDTGTMASHDFIDERCSPSDAMNALVFVPGRASEAAAIFDGCFSDGSIPSAIPAGLLRDGHSARALHYAERILREATHLSSAEVIQLAPVVMTSSRDAASRTRNLLNQVIAELPGSPSAPAEAWLREKPTRMSRTRGSPENALRDQLRVLFGNGHRAEEATLRAKYGEALLGELRRYVTRFDGSRASAFEWEGPDIRSATFGFHPQYLAAVPPGLPCSLDHALTLLLSHPSSGRLEALSITMNSREGAERFDPGVRILAERGAPNLRRLRLGEINHGWRAPPEAVRGKLAWLRFVSLHELWPRLTELEELTLQGDLQDDVLGELALPSLRSLTVITCALARENMQAISRAHWPSLETLELWLGDPAFGATTGIEDLRRIFEGRATPALKRLRLMNASFTDDIIRELAQAPLTAQLIELDLSLGTLTDEGAETLLQQAGAFRHLALLNVEDNYLSRDTFGPLEKCFPTVRIGTQKAAKAGEVSVSVFD
jgi:hypothetical protein